MFQSGIVYIPNKKWATNTEKNGLIDFVAAFPNGAPPSADLCDTVTQACIYLRSGLWVTHPDDDEETDNRAIHNQDIDEDDMIIESKSLYA